MAKKNAAKEIWDKLSRIDVSDHVEQKMGLSYLSWAWAWGTLMNNVDSAEYSFTRFEGLDVMTYPDGSCAVECNLTFEGVTRSMWLPVMDHRNNAIPSPSSRHISDTKMRALVKTIAMFGLGHYIFAGESLPSNPLDNIDVDKLEGSETDVDSQAAKEVDELLGSKDDTYMESQPVDAAIEILEPDTIQTFNLGSIKTLKELGNFWKAQKEEVNKLKETDPEKRNEIVAAFEAKKAELKTTKEKN